MTFPLKLALGLKIADLLLPKTLGDTHKPPAGQKHRRIENLSHGHPANLDAASGILVLLQPYQVLDKFSSLSEPP